MSVTEPTAPATSADARPTRHESFLAHDHFRFLKWAVGMVAAALVLYIVVRPYGTPYGGGWAGYTLGTVGALLILWLTWFGYRKRSYAENHGRLAARLSAHVYLGLALFFVATLHTGFHFGWNIHTLAYALMCIVIASGIFGLVAYARYPRLMTENRESMTTVQMLGRIAGVDDDLRLAAMPLDDATVAAVERAIASTEIGGSAWRQLSGHYPGCTTAGAIAHMQAHAREVPATLEEPWRQTRLKLEEKGALLQRIRADIRYKALMEVWLYLHVPLTFALLAALTAHIVCSVSSCLNPLKAAMPSPTIPHPRWIVTERMEVDVTVLTRRGAARMYAPGAACERAAHRAWPRHRQRGAARRHPSRAAYRCAGAARGRHRHRQSRRVAVDRQRQQRGVVGVEAGRRDPPRSLPD